MEDEHQPAPVIAIGADGAPGGWLAACLHATSQRRADSAVWETRLHLAEDIGELATMRDREGSVAAVAIDVPIGLPDSVRYRVCDIEARERLGERRNSVFAPPARYMIAAAGDYKRIRELVEQERAHNPGAKSISAQAAGITRKIAEVDAWVQGNRNSEDWLWECHPELSFWALNKGAHCGAKASAAGLVQRLNLLRERFPDIETRIAAAPWSGKDVALSDILDAYAALTTALVCARGKQEELGNGERDSERVPMRMAV